MEITSKIDRIVVNLTEIKYEKHNDLLLKNDDREISKVNEMENKETIKPINMNDLLNGDLKQEISQKDVDEINAEMEELFGTSLTK